VTVSNASTNSRSAITETKGVPEAAGLSFPHSKHHDVGGESGGPFTQRFCSRPPRISSLRE